MRKRGRNLSCRIKIKKEGETQEEEKKLLYRKIADLEEANDSLREEIRSLSQRPSGLWGVFLLVVGLILIGFSTVSDSLVLVIDRLGIVFLRNALFIFKPREAS